MSLKVSHLSKNYGDQWAVNDISFDIPEGQIVGFLGPNGAGKSTTMKIITTYLDATSGEVEVCDMNIKEKPIEVKRNIGYLPESNPLYTDMYVKEYMNYVANIFSIENKEARIKEIIDITGLGIEQDKKIYELSKGYRQRIGLAQAMIHDPKVLILDEPTSGLDPNQLVEIRNLIKEIGKEKTVMLSTHIMQEVEAMCERVIIINKGKIVADNTTKDIKKTTSVPIIKVSFNKPVDLNKLKSLKNVKQVLQENEVYKIALKDDNYDIREDLFSLAVKENWSILNLSQEEQNLENVFKELTK